MDHPFVVVCSLSGHSMQDGLELGDFRRRDEFRSVAQIITTLALFAAGWWAMWASLSIGYWLTLVLAVPTAGLLLRLFVLQHDCGHGAMFRDQRANHAVGTVLGVLTMTPYHCWRRQHALHHATNGQLDHRGFGDVTTLTLDEYADLPLGRRLAYHVYRHPLMLMVIGPFFYFALYQRLPSSVPAAWHRERRSIHLTNALVLLSLVAAAAVLGPMTVVKLHLPVVAIASSIGTWLFFVQHQFLPTYWERDATWDHARAAVEGSSFLDLPWLLNWMTASIGYHHVHHLDSRIPNYALAACHAAHPSLRSARRLTLLEGLRCTRLKLWDERTQEMITFREAGQRLQDRIAGAVGRTGPRFHG
jgi:omega-6 fatty acid desaturase (delta-12 desaturase)